MTFALHLILNPSPGFTTHDTGCLSMVTCGGKVSSRKERREGERLYRLIIILLILLLLTLYKLKEKAGCVGL